MKRKYVAMVRNAKDHGTSKMNQHITVQKVSLHSKANMVKLGSRIY